jgi:endonuclease/exonuclease/phosphatase (EEP) superfamily protein YafD
MSSLPTLAELITDPKYDFLSQFSSESDGISNYEIFNEANDNPYESLQISCDYYDENEYSLKYRNLKNFSMLSLNIQSLSAKFNEFRELLSHFDSAACSPDIIFIQETWKIFDPTHFSLHNYSPLQFICRDNRQGGGVGLYFKSGLQYKIIKEKSLFLDFIIETIVAEVTLPNNKKMAVVSIYRPPTSHPTLSHSDQIEQFMDLFTNLISDLQNCYTDVYILGDLNIDVLKYDSNQLAQDYVDLLFSYGLLQVITKPTRYSNSSATLIDHVITAPKSNFCNAAILTSMLSDHFPIIYILDSAKTRVCEKSVNFRDFSQANILRFKETLHSFSWNTVIGSDDAQEAYNCFSSSLISLLDVYFPLKTAKFNRNFNPIEKWMTKGLLISRRKKYALSKKCVVEPSQMNINTFKTYRNVYNKQLDVQKSFISKNSSRLTNLISKKLGRFLKRQLITRFKNLVVSTVLL